MLVAYTAASACIAFFYLPPAGLGVLLLVSITHAATLAPISPIADALALGASTTGLRYGWVRGAGSAAFILGTLLSGQAVARFGLSAIIWLNAILFAVAAGCARTVPELPAPSTPQHHVGGTASLLRLPGFRRLMVVAALVQGSHAFHDGFVVIHWRSLGIGDGTIGALWSGSVAAEIVVFLLIGRPLIDRLGPAGASMLAAAGGVIRWAVLAQATSVAALALVEPLHGLTFALQHLACMRLIGAIVPPHLAATAQACYGTVAVGIASATLTLASGPLFAHYGAGGFWVMAVLCAAAIPLARKLPSATH